MKLYTFKNWLNYKLLLPAMILYFTFVLAIFIILSGALLKDYSITFDNEINSFYLLHEKNIQMFEYSSFLTDLKAFTYNKTLTYMELENEFGVEITKLTSHNMDFKYIEFHEYKLNFISKNLKLLLSLKHGIFIKYASEFGSKLNHSYLKINVLIPFLVIFKNLFYFFAFMLVFSLTFILIIRRYFNKSIKEINSNILEIVFNFETITTLNDLKQISLKNTRVDELQRLITSYNSLIERVTDAEESSRKNEILASVGEMSQLVAHDVRKPFNSLKMVLQVLSNNINLEDKDKKLISTFSENIKKQINSVEILLDDIMKIDKNDSLILTEIDPTLIITSALEKTNIPNFKDTNLIRVDLQHKFKINAHSEKLERVFLNIIMNAYEIIANCGKIWIKSYEEMNIENIKFTTFCIGNSNSYISPEDIDKLFKKFFTKNKKNGTGLGLMICKRIVDAHGGKIWCESSKEVGVEFFFQVPTANALCDELNQESLAK